MCLFLQLVEIECGAEEAPSIFSSENEVYIGGRGGGIGEVPPQGLAKLEGGEEEENGEEEGGNGGHVLVATCYARVIRKLQFYGE